MRKVIAVCVAVAMLFTNVSSYAQGLVLPDPGAMVQTSAAFVPVMMRGLKIDPKDPFLFDFLIDNGNTGLALEGAEFSAESEKLIKYFLASLTIKEEDLWVNLSPYEKDRMIPDDLRKTVLGRDMLAQDYILKQLTASMIYPEKDLGKKFWDKVYSQAREKFGTTDIPVDTFNKVWITADRAKVLERNGAGYVVNSHLKVMLESDYVAANQRAERDGGEVPNPVNSALAAEKAQDTGHKTQEGASESQELAKNILREIVIPAIEKEVNEGQNFAPLRQIFYAMILASWYKQSLKQTFLTQVYANKGKVDGVQSDDPNAGEVIYTKYLQAYKTGVFNLIKEETDAKTGETLPRKYFSGGIRTPHTAYSRDLGPDDQVGREGEMANVEAALETPELAMGTEDVLGQWLSFSDLDKGLDSDQARKVHDEWAKARSSGKKKKFPRGFWVNRKTVINYLLAVLDVNLIDPVGGKGRSFEKARQARDIKQMADLYRDYVLGYQAQDQEKYHNGQQSFFYEVGGLEGLMNNNRHGILDKKASPAAVLRLLAKEKADEGLAGLVDADKQDALKPWELEEDYWTEETAAKAVVNVLKWNIPRGEFTDAMTRRDIPEMAKLYRQYVLGYKSENPERYRGSEQAFFYEKGGLEGLMSHPRSFLDKTGSPAAILRLVTKEGGALEGLIGPQGLKKEEIERERYTRAQAGQEAALADGKTRFSESAMKKKDEGAATGSSFGEGKIVLTGQNLIEEGRRELTAGKYWVGNELVRFGRAIELTEKAIEGSVFKEDLTIKDLSQIIRAMTRGWYSPKEVRLFATQIRKCCRMIHEGQSKDEVITYLKGEYEAIHAPARSAVDGFTEIANYETGSHHAEIATLLKNLRIPVVFAFDLDMTLTKADPQNFNHLVTSLKQSPNAFVGIATHRPYLFADDSTPDVVRVPDLKTVRPYEGFFKNQIEMMGIDPENQNFIIGLVMDYAPKSEWIAGDRYSHMKFYWYLRTKDDAQKVREYLVPAESSYEGTNKFAGIGNLVEHFRDVLSEEKNLDAFDAEAHARAYLHRAVLMMADDDPDNVHLPITGIPTKEKHEALIGPHALASHESGLADLFRSGRIIIDTAPDPTDRDRTGHFFKFEKDVLNGLEATIDDPLLGVHTTNIRIKAHRVIQVPDSEGELAMASKIRDLKFELAIPNRSVSAPGIYYGKYKDPAGKPKLKPEETGQFFAFNMFAQDLDGKYRISVWTLSGQTGHELATVAVKGDQDTVEAFVRYLDTDQGFQACNRGGVFSFYEWTERKHSEFLTVVQALADKAEAAMTQQEEKDAKVQATLLNHKIAELVAKLNGVGIKPRVHRQDLLLYDADAMVKFIQEHTVLKRPMDIARVLSWRLQTGGRQSKHQVLSGMSSSQAEDLFDAIFDQEAYLKERTSQTPANVVLFRRGRSKPLTHILKTIQHVNVKVMLSGTDDGQSWRYGADAFDAVGIPGAGKALLDLSRDVDAARFCAYRIHGEGRTPLELENDFRLLVDHIENPRPSDKLSKEMKSLYNSFLRIENEKSDGTGKTFEKRKAIAASLKKFLQYWDERRHVLSAAEFFELKGVPIRSILLVGMAQERSGNWQQAVNDLARILNVREGHEVIFPTEKRGHMIALGKDGKLYLSEGGINFGRQGAEFLKLWTVDQAVHQQLIGALSVSAENGRSIVLRKVPKGSAPDVRLAQELRETLRIVDQDSIQDMASFLDAHSIHDPLVDHAREAFQNADVLFYSGEDLETNIAGALIVPGVADAIGKSVKSLKVNVSEVASTEGPAVLESTLSRLVKYIGGDEMTLANPKAASYVDYVLAGAVDNVSPTEIQNSLLEIEKSAGRKIKATSVDAAINQGTGFYSSTALIDSVISLLGIKMAGFAVSASEGLIPLESKVPDRNEMGLFTRDVKVNELIEYIKSHWDEIVAKGAFAFDVDKTILPKISDGLNEYKELAYLFMRLLREGVPVAIISGNSLSEQMPRIHDAIKDEMRDDLSAFQNLTFYVDGGATKVEFDENDTVQMDEVYNQSRVMGLETMRPAVNDALEEFAKRRFGLDAGEQQRFRDEFKAYLAGNKRYKNLKVDLSWMESKSLPPPILWLTPEELDGLNAKGGTVTGPWVEMRGKKDDDHVASLSIKPTPESGKNSLRGELQAMILARLKAADVEDGKYNLRSGGNTSTDITQANAEKPGALLDFIMTKGTEKAGMTKGIKRARLDPNLVFYIADEFGIGNDEVIARSPDPILAKVHTLSVSDGNMKGAHPKTTWIGRTSQATEEFLGALLEAAMAVKIKDLEFKPTDPNSHGQGPGIYYGAWKEPSGKPKAEGSVESFAFNVRKLDQAGQYSIDVWRLRGKTGSEIGSLMVKTNGEAAEEDVKETVKTFVRDYLDTEEGFQACARVFQMATREDANQELLTVVRDEAARAEAAMTQLEAFKNYHIIRAAADVALDALTELTDDEVIQLTPEKLKSIVAGSFTTAEPLVGGMSLPKALAVTYLFFLGLHRNNDVPQKPNLKDLVKKARIYKRNTKGQLLAAGLGPLNIPQYWRNPDLQSVADEMQSAADALAASLPQELASAVLPQASAQLQPKVVGTQPRLIFRPRAPAGAPRVVAKPSAAVAVPQKVTPQQAFESLAQQKFGVELPASGGWRFLSFNEKGGAEFIGLRLSPEGKVEYLKLSFAPVPMAEFEGLVVVNQGENSGQIIGWQASGNLRSIPEKRAAFDAAVAGKTYVVLPQVPIESAMISNGMIFGEKPTASLANTPRVAARPRRDSPIVYEMRVDILVNNLLAQIENPIEALPTVDGFEDAINLMLASWVKEIPHDKTGHIDPSKLLALGVPRSLLTRLRNVGSRFVLAEAMRSRINYEVIRESGGSQHGLPLMRLFNAPAKPYSRANLSMMFEDSWQLPMAFADAKGQINWDAYFAQTRQRIDWATQEGRVYSPRPSGWWQRFLANESAMKQTIQDNLSVEDWIAFVQPLENVVRGLVELKPLLPLVEKLKSAESPRDMWIAFADIKDKINELDKGVQGQLWSALAQEKSFVNSEIVRFMDRSFQETFDRIKGDRVNPDYRIKLRSKDFIAGIFGFAIPKLNEEHPVFWGYILKDISGPLMRKIAEHAPEKAMKTAAAVAHEFFKTFEGPVYYPAGEFDLHSVMDFLKIFPQLKSVVIADPFVPGEGTILGKKIAPSQDLTDMARQMREGLSSQNALGFLVSSVETTHIDHGTGEIRFRLQFKDGRSIFPEHIRGKSVDLVYRIKKYEDISDPFAVIFVRGVGLAGRRGEESAFWQKILSQGPRYILRSKIMTAMPDGLPMTLVESFDVDASKAQDTITVYQPRSGSEFAMSTLPLARQTQVQLAQGFKRYKSEVEKLMHLVTVSLGKDKLGRYRNHMEDARQETLRAMTALIGAQGVYDEIKKRGEINPKDYGERPNLETRWVQANTGNFSGGMKVLDAIERFAHGEKDSGDVLTALARAFLVPGLLVGLTGENLDRSAFDLMKERGLSDSDKDELMVHVQMVRHDFEAAMAKGGIDLNAKKMELDIEKSGTGVSMTIDPAMMQKFRSGDFTGLVPVILKVTPIDSPLPILGMSDKDLTPVAHADVNQPMVMVRREEGLVA